MKQWSFIVWSLMCAGVVVGAYVLNMTDVATREHSVAVLASSTISGVEQSVTVEQSRNTRLDSIAKKRANDMSERRYYSHRNPDGSYFFDYFSEYGIAVDTPSCENLLLLRSGLTREEVDRAWIESPEHKACLDADHLSFGYAETTFDSDLDLSVYVYIAASL